MSLRLKRVLLHDYGEMPIEGFPKTKDLSFLQYLEDCHDWAKKVIATYGRMDGVTRARLGKRLVALLVSDICLSASSGSGGADHSVFSQNFGPYHLPSDTQMISIAYTKFLCLGSKLRPAGLPPPGVFARVNPVKVIHASR